MSSGAIITVRIRTAARRLYPFSEMTLATYDLSPSVIRLLPMNGTITRTPIRP